MIWRENEAKNKKTGQLLTGPDGTHAYQYVFWEAHNSKTSVKPTPRESALALVLNALFDIKAFDPDVPPTSGSSGGQNLDQSGVVPVSTMSTVRTPRESEETVARPDEPEDEPEEEEEYESSAGEGNSADDPPPSNEASEEEEFESEEE